MPSHPLVLVTVLVTVAATGIMGVQGEAVLPVGPLCSGGGPGMVPRRLRVAYGALFPEECVDLSPFDLSVEPPPVFTATQMCPEGYGLVQRDATQVTCRPLAPSVVCSGFAPPMPVETILSPLTLSPTRILRGLDVNGYVVYAESCRIEVPAGTPVTDCPDGTALRQLYFNGTIRCAGQAPDGVPIPFQPLEAIRVNGNIPFCFHQELMVGYEFAPSGLSARCRPLSMLVPQMDPYPYLHGSDTLTCADTEGLHLIGAQVDGPSQCAKVQRPASCQGLVSHVLGSYALCIDLRASMGYPWEVPVAATTGPVQACPTGAFAVGTDGVNFWCMAFGGIVPATRRLQSAPLVLDLNTQAANYTVVGWDGLNQVYLARVRPHLRSICGGSTSMCMSAVVDSAGDFRYGCLSVPLYPDTDIAHFSEVYDVPACPPDHCIVEEGSLPNTFVCRRIVSPLRLITSTVSSFHAVPIIDGPPYNALAIGFRDATPDVVGIDATFFYAPLPPYGLVAADCDCPDGYGLIKGPLWAGGTAIQIPHLSERCRFFSATLTGPVQQLPMCSNDQVTVGIRDGQPLCRTLPPGLYGEALHTPATLDCTNPPDIPFPLFMRTFMNNALPSSNPIYDTQCIVPVLTGELYGDYFTCPLGQVIVGVDLQPSYRCSAYFLAGNALILGPPVPSVGGECPGASAAIGIQWGVVLCASIVHITEPSYTVVDVSYGTMPIPVVVPFGGHLPLRSLYPHYEQVYYTFTVPPPTDPPATDLPTTELPTTGSPTTLDPTTAGAPSTTPTAAAPTTITTAWTTAAVTTLPTIAPATETPTPSSPAPVTEAPPTSGQAATTAPTAAAATTQPAPTTVVPLTVKSSTAPAQTPAAPTTTPPQTAEPTTSNVLNTATAGGSTTAPSTDIPTAAATTTATAPTSDGHASPATSTSTSSSAAATTTSTPTSTTPFPTALFAWLGGQPGGAALFSTRPAPPLATTPVSNDSTGPDFSLLQVLQEGDMLVTVRLDLIDVRFTLALDIELAVQYAGLIQGHVAAALHVPPADVEVVRMVPGSTVVFIQILNATGHALNTSTVLQRLEGSARDPESPFVTPLRVLSGTFVAAYRETRRASAVSVATVSGLDATTGIIVAIIVAVVVAAGVFGCCCVASGRGGVRERCGLWCVSLCGARPSAQPAMVAKKTATHVTATNTSITPDEELLYPFTETPPPDDRSIEAIIAAVTDAQMKRWREREHHQHQSHHIQATRSTDIIRGSDAGNNTRNGRLVRRRSWHIELAEEYAAGGGTGQHRHDDQRRRHCVHVRAVERDVDEHAEAVHGIVFGGMHVPRRLTPLPSPPTSEEEIVGSPTRAKTGAHRGAARGAY